MRRRTTLDDFVARLVAAEGDREALSTVFERFETDPRSVAEWVRPRKGRYTRSLVFRDELLEVLVLTWSARSEAPIHDHANQNCWMAVVHGTLEVIGYRRTDGGSGAGPAKVEPDGPMRRLEAGEVDTRDARADLHCVRAAADSDLAISVHAYSRPLDRCLVFDPRRGTCAAKRLRYDFVGPRSRHEGAPLELSGYLQDADVSASVDDSLREPGSVTEDPGASSPRPGTGTGSPAG